jgi:alkylhydroperoxidase family enzyme
MARISRDPPLTLGYRLGSRFSRRRYGVMPDPGAAIGQNMPVGRSYAIFELRVERWRQLDRELKDLAVMAVAAAIGCAWCMDFGFWEATVNHAVPAEKVREMANWQGRKVFSELELLVMEYAEAMTVTPPRVTDAMVEALRQHLAEAQLVELTAIIAVENLRSRINSALGLTAQGFKDRCGLPAAGDSAPAGPGSRPGPQ